MNLHRSETFVFAVVPFDQIWIDFGCAAEAGQFAGASGALQRTRQDLREVQSGEPFAKPAGIAFATLGQRQIGKPRMLTGKAPGGLAVARQINHWKDVAQIAESDDRPIPLLSNVDFIKRSLASFGLPNADRASKSM